MWSIANLDELRRAHEEFIARQQRIIELTLTQAGAVAIQHVQTSPDFTPRTGALQKATRFRVVRAPNGRVMRLSNNKAYAAAIDTGARPHTISANKAPYLHFRGRNGWARVKSVNHPGNKPYKFMYNAHDAANRFFRRELERDLTALGARF